MKPYRKNVGIVVFNRAGRVIAGERIRYPNTFQFPQGGIDDGEDPLAAARRELYEEIGLEIQDEPVGEIPDWLYYQFPPDIPARLNEFRGQQQKWFFFFWDGAVEDLKLDLHEREFSSVRWLSLEEVTENIVPFKQEVYARIKESGGQIISDYLRLLDGTSLPEGR